MTRSIMPSMPRQFERGTSQSRAHVTLSARMCSALRFQVTASVRRTTGAEPARRRKPPAPPLPLLTPPTMSADSSGSSPGTRKLFAISETLDVEARDAPTLLFRRVPPTPLPSLCCKCARKFCVPIEMAKNRFFFFVLPAYSLLSAASRHNRRSLRVSNVYRAGEHFRALKNGFRYQSDSCCNIKSAKRV